MKREADFLADIHDSLERVAHDHAAREDVRQQIRNRVMHLTTDKAQEIERLRDRVRSLEISHAEVSTIAVGAQAERALLSKAVMRGISALACLPPDEGPIRRQASAAIDEMRAALETVGEEIEFH